MRKVRLRWAKRLFGTKTWYCTGFLRAESELQLGLKMAATKGFLLSFCLASFASFLFSGSTLSVTKRQRLTLGLMRKTSIVLACENSRFSSLFAAGDVSPGGGGHFRNFLVGMCRWDPGTLDLYQS